MESLSKFNLEAHTSPLAPSYVMTSRSLGAQFALNVRIALACIHFLGLGCCFFLCLSWSSLEKLLYSHLAPKQPSIYLCIDLFSHYSVSLVYSSDYDSDKINWLIIQLLQTRYVSLLIHKPACILGNYFISWPMPL